jgi:hypothetical protein
MRLNGDFPWHSSATNLMPLRGEAFLFCIRLLRTLYRCAAKHFTFDKIPFNSENSDSDKGGAM